MSFRPCFDHKRIKLREIYSTQKERMFAKIPSRGVKFRFRFSPPFLLSQKRSRRKDFSFLLISYFFFSKKKKRKGKPLSHFFFSSLSFQEVEEMALFLTFSPLSSLSFQKKRRRKVVEEGEVFSLSFLSFSFLFHFFFKRKRREEELLFPLSFSLWEKISFLIPFPFFFLF